MSMTITYMLCYFNIGGSRRGRNRVKEVGTGRERAGEGMGGQGKAVGGLTTYKYYMLFVILISCQSRKGREKQGRTEDGGRG